MPFTRFSLLSVLLAGAAAIAAPAVRPFLVRPPRSSRIVAVAITPRFPSYDRGAAGDASQESIEFWAKARRISGPALVNTLIDPILSLIDTIYISQMGCVLSLGATAVSSELFTLCLAVSLALRESASSTLSRLTGTGDTEGARAFARRTLTIALVSGILLGIVIGGPTAPACLSAMGAGPGSPLHSQALG